MTRTMKKLLHHELTYKINGICFKVHRELGRFCRERQYCDAIEKLLKEAGIEYKREYELVKLVSSSPAGNRVDFLIENIIILDIKAKKFITKEDYIQMIRYLEAANIELGIIINFRHTYLKPKRILNSKLNPDNPGVSSGKSVSLKHENKS